MTESNKTRFSLSQMMLATLFMSLVMAATFIQSDVVFAVSTLAVFVFVAWYCVHTQVRPTVTGALLGLTVPALMSLHLLGEIVAPVPTGEYADTKHNVPIAVMTLVFVGGAGAWLGTLIGMIAGIVSGKMEK